MGSFIYGQVQAIRAFSPNGHYAHALMASRVSEDMFRILQYPLSVQRCLQNNFFQYK